uniref:Pentraxin family member n=1 Tax=Neogobius melanostomus TaxID=47308 RepID=A0A8C6SSU9_9GOBI
MQFVVCLIILISNAAAIEDLSGKMFVFPQQTNTAHVKLTPSKTSFTVITVCHRSFTDLKREHVLFSMAIPSNTNEFAIIYKFATNEMQPHMKRDKTSYGGLNYKINTWHSICTTWDSTSGLVQLWFNGQQLIKKYVNPDSTPPGTPIIVLGQEQDSHGGGFDINQSFVGMMTDVHMWDYVVSSCEIQKYMSELSFTPGNVLNWAALDFLIRDRVLIENKQLYCQ